MHRFFVPAHQIQNSRAVIRGGEFHHLHHVLRLCVGDRISLRDEVSTEHHGVIASLSTTAAEVMILDTTPLPSTAVSLTLALGLLKGQKMDLVIEKVTELGVDRIVPFTSAFTIFQLPTERQNERLSRWRRITQSAAKQSGSMLPQILAPQTFDQLCDSQVPDTTTILFYEQERLSTLKEFANNHPQIPSLRVIVGPEGGFAAEEVELARRRGIHILGLGSQILRAETASIVAIALCRFLWEGRAIPPLPPR